MVYDTQRTETAHLPCPIIINDVVTRIDADCVTKIVYVSPAVERFAADGLHEPGLHMSADHDAGANVVETAFAVVACLEIAIDELVIQFGNDLAQAAGEERDANLASGERAHEGIHD